MKYKKKPVVIDAVQWTGNNHREMFDFLTQDTFNSETMEISDKHFYIDRHNDRGLVIKTSEGDMNVNIGDYVIKEPFDKERMYYPCKEDIFNQTYEKVENNPTYPIFGEPINCQPNGTGKIPYHTICSCNPAKGGSGICGCSIGSNMIDNPNSVNITTGSNMGISGITTTGTYTYRGIKPQLNGVPCPKCGTEMMDTHPNIILTSDPAQKNVHCPKCGHKGYRFV
jgi:DNA-directed RNA polymerase subunit RPC12/RpoP